MFRGQPNFSRLSRIRRGHCPSRGIGSTTDEIPQDASQFRDLLIREIQFLLLALSRDQAVSQQFAHLGRLAQQLRLLFNLLPDADLQIFERREHGRVQFPSGSLPRGHNITD